MISVDHIYNSNKNALTMLVSYSVKNALCWRPRYLWPYHTITIFCENIECVYLLFILTKKLHRCLTGSYLFHDGGPYQVETNPLICWAYHLIGFHMIRTSIMKYFFVRDCISWVTASLPQLHIGFRVSRHLYLCLSTRKWRKPFRNLLRRRIKKSFRTSLRYPIKIKKMK